MWISYPLKNKRIQRFFFNQVTRYNNGETEYVGDFFEISKLKDASYPKRIWGRPQKVAFENIELYAPEKLHDYLSFYFGDYMQLPPIEKRVCGHHNGVSFGRY